MIVPNFSTKLVKLFQGDSLKLYKHGPSPTCIVSDGAYGILGFEGDTSTHSTLPEWYEPHIKRWSKYATGKTTLWFWNTEIGWAVVHPILEKYGWRYVNANVWDKGLSRIAGNVNTKTIRRFPVVSEVCVHYVFESRINGKLIKEWLRDEWLRSGLSLNKANEACGVSNVATRKYLTQDACWYFPPDEMFDKLSKYANKHGSKQGRPYFSLDGKVRSDFRSRFNCPFGTTNVWSESSLHSSERIKTSTNKFVHPNQKPLALMSRIIEASTNKEEVVWEPFGGLFTGCLAAKKLGRIAYGAEILSDYFKYGSARFKSLFN